MLKIANTVLVVIDVQEKLFPAIYQKDSLVSNLQKLIRGAQVLELPILVSEQYPQGLGRTVAEIAALLAGISPVPKISFSSYGDETFRRSLQSLNRQQVLVAGIESHVCVYQTVSDMVSAGYETVAVTDAISSRTPENREIGFKVMARGGAQLSSVEAVLFELLGVAKGDKFKAINQLLK